MRSKIFIGSLIVFMIFNISCRKASIYPDSAKFNECSNTQNTDSTALGKKIVGIWKLIYVISSDVGTLKDKDVKVNFLPNGSLKIYEYSFLTEEGNWEIVKYGTNKYALHIIEHYKYLFDYGSICYDQLYYNNSAVDGLAILYEKVY